MMSLTAIFSSGAAANASCVARQVSPRILSSLPMTRSTSAISANICGCVCAAQPVTTMRAPGCSRFSRRIDCRACATASFVTAQLLMTMVSDSPARSASRAITSDSKALRRQPKVTTSTVMLSGKQRGIEAPLIFEGRRARHQHVVIAFAPFDRKIAAGKLNLHNTIGALQPRRRDRSSARSRAASHGQPGAALPGADRNVVAIDDMGERNIGALRKDRMVFQERPEPRDIVGADIIDPENRVRIAHVDRGWRMQQRRVDRADL